MAIKTNGLGGTDWTDEILYSVDLVGTFNAITTPLDTGLNITRDSATGSAAVVSITQDNAGDYQPALSIQQDGAGMGLYVAVTKDVTNGQCARFFNSGKGANTIITQLAGGYSALGTNRFYRNLASADTTGPVVGIVQDNAGDNQATLKIQQDGTGNGLYIDQNGNGLAFNIAQATNGGGIYIGNFGTGDGIELNNDGAGVGVNIDQSSAGGIGLSIKNAGTANGLFIDQDGNGIALNIDNDGTNTGINVDIPATGGDGITVTSASTGLGKSGIEITSTGATSYASLKITHASSSSAIQVTSSSGPCMNLTNSNNDAYIKFTGSSTGANTGNNELFYDGTNLKFKDSGGTVRTISWT